MRRPALFIGIFCAALLAACWERHAERNDRRAYFARVGNTYRVELHGWRFPLVHDPLSLLLERTRRVTVTLELPRLEGTIDGSAIPVGPDRYRYAGRLVIAGRTMTVDLYYNDRRPLPWNDEYTLVQADGEETFSATGREAAAVRGRFVPKRAGDGRERVAVTVRFVANRRGSCFPHHGASSAHGFARSGRATAGPV